MKKLSFNSLLVSLNILLLGCIGFLSIYGFNRDARYQEIEAQKITVRSPKGEHYLQIKMVDQTPFIAFYEKNQPTIEIKGGNYPSISFRNKSDRLALQLATKDNGSCELSFFDNKGKNSLQCVGGSSPAIYLKSDKKTIGSWTMLDNGGSGIGLASKDGGAAAILRGGYQPALAFFSSKNIPIASFGMMQKTPHMMISGKEKNSGVLIHGGDPTGVLVMDEEGRTKILISKEGVFQGKEEETEPQSPKLFTHREDLMRLFPDEEQAIAY